MIPSNSETISTNVLIVFINSTPSSFLGINHLFQLQTLVVSSNNLSSLDGIHFEKLSELKYIAFDNNFILSLSPLQVNSV